MRDDDLVAMLRAVIQEELKPVNERLASLEQGQQELRFGQQSLQKEVTGLRQDQQELRFGQQSLQKEVSKIRKDVNIIKKELRLVWGDILKLDKRLTRQEELSAR